MLAAVHHYRGRAGMDTLDITNTAESDLICTLRYENS